MLDNNYNNNIDNILTKCIDKKQQRYNILIKNYNCKQKQKANSLLVNKHRSSYSNKEKIRENKREVTA